MSSPFSSIAVVGAGKMGGALVDGWLSSDQADSALKPDAVSLIDPVFASGGDAWRAKGVHCFDSAAAYLAAAQSLPDLLMLAIKPQMMETVLPDLAPFDHGALTVLSIAAGTRYERLQTAFPHAVCIRAMPNTPAAIGQGITAAYGPKADDQRRAAVMSLLRAVGEAVWLDDEQLIDAVTAVSGSGPAYVFHMVEALAKAGEAVGLPSEAAMALARQTLVGAGALLQSSPDSAEQLRINVTSPGGTTAAGLSVLQQSGRLDALLCETVQAAFDRSIALSSSEDDDGS